MEKRFECVAELIRSNPFATVVTINDDRPQISHLPILLRSAAGVTDRFAGKLIGHMSRQNQQWRHFGDSRLATVIFRGPHAYISPTWYAVGDVPTWNYGVVHVYGHAKIIESFRELIGALEEITARFESAEPQPWDFNLPPDLKKETDLMEAIIGFEIEIEDIDVKFKLGQNRSLEDRQGVLRGLKGRSDEMSHSLGDLMTEMW